MKLSTDKKKKREKSFLHEVNNIDFEIHSL